jgi:histidinol phosphatase-like PHP family hydrolase
MGSVAMTRRKVRAVSDGHADLLGHCTGRLVARGRGIRPESKFDAEAVFAACRYHGTAVEINSRPVRADPPTRLFKLAQENRLHVRHRYRGAATRPAVGTTSPVRVCGRPVRRP